MTISKSKEEIIEILRKEKHLLIKANQQCEDILTTCELLRSDVNRYEAEQSIPFELHFESTLIQSGVSNHLN